MKYRRYLQLKGRAPALDASVNRFTGLRLSTHFRPPFQVALSGAAPDAPNTRGKTPQKVVISA